MADGYRHQPGEVRPGPLARLVDIARAHPFEAAVTVAAALYFCLALSPSSYGYALRIFGVPDTHTYFGTARVERWDEWAVQTPTLQAAVRSHFATHNTTSFYNEAFRTVVPIPMRDWGLAFRPLFVGYFFLPAAWAFSLSWAAAGWMVLVGWCQVLRRIGITYLVAIAASLTILLAPFTQTWLSAYIALLAFLPWILLCVVSRRRVGLLVPVIAWLSACFVVSAEYLLGLVALGFVAAVFVLAFTRWRDDVGRFVVLAAAAAGGATAALLYLAPVLRAMAATTYPGHRVVPGGTLPAAQWLAQVAPFGATQGFTSLVHRNLPESAAMGSWLPLLAIALVDYRRLWSADRRLRAHVLKPVVISLAGVTLLGLWQLVPVFHPIGAVFLWNRSEEQRSLIASGLLLVFAAAWVLSRFPLRVTPARIAAFAAAAGAASVAPAVIVQRSGVGSVLANAHDDFAVLAMVVVAAAMVLFVSLHRPLRERAGLVALAAVIPVIVPWALFNPVQDTRPLFRRIDSPVTASLNAAAAARPDGVIAANFPGSTLNGQGYRSVTMVLQRPQVQAFARMFPELPAATIDAVFNRYAELFVDDAAAPHVASQGVVNLPRAKVQRIATIPAASGYPLPSPPSGHLADFSLVPAALIELLFVVVVALRR